MKTVVLCTVVLSLPFGVAEEFAALRKRQEPFTRTPHGPALSSPAG
jgi:hypothetical protein